MASNQLPYIPAPLVELPTYLAQHPDKPLTQLFLPYRKFEATVRGLYAQEPDNPALKDAYVNTLPVFTQDTAKIQVRARDLAAESEKEKSKYIMPLPEENRRLSGTMAVVPSLKEFQDNFSIFSELSLSGLNWDNVVAAGSSVVNCLMPIPDEFSQSKRTMREYYHEKFCPASDVDLFLYGLSEKEAVEKIKEIERAVRDSILADTTTVRTKNAITICSQYPTRHVQIVLRIYKSVSEILTGFDIDCSGAAYDGSQVYCTPRALQSYMTQINQIDLTRRSPSYENRLSKYSHRNFEVFWAELDRSRIDPTIFDRSFQRTMGLARLLVLERLPSPWSRQAYSNQRRQERGRPSLNWNFQCNRNAFTTAGNIKDNFDDEVAEWVSQEDVSSYTTFVIPYGHFYHAKKIEKLCYTRDLLLNAEWNQKKDREVYLHRHPAFFGRAEDVVKDCCGFCPQPETQQEKDIAAEESKLYISGKLSFIKDDPGRQSIGSFNPLTDDDWTSMAYVGNTSRLCQAIVDGDLEQVNDWLSQDGANPNRRDHTGRTPLQLAVKCSTPDIVHCLVDKGARLIARLADGKTALHLAAERGSVEVIKILMDKSIANKAEEEEKEDQRRRVQASTAKESLGKEKVEADNEAEDEDEEDEDEQFEELNADDDGGSLTETTGSLMKVKRKEGDEEPFVLDDDVETADVYDVDITAWDRPCSALHLAIMAGHEKVVKLLCEEYGAAVLLPVKFFDKNGNPSSSLLTLTLTMTLPVEKAKTTIATLLSLGATSAQGDLNGVTPFFSFAGSGEVQLLETLLEHDKTGSSRAINHVSFPDGRTWSNPLLAAISVGDAKMVVKLLDAGASLSVGFDEWLKSAKAVGSMSTKLLWNTPEEMFQSGTDQPLIAALRSPRLSIALDLLERGADPNTEPKEWVELSKLEPGCRFGRQAFQSPLAVVHNYIETLKSHSREQGRAERPHKLREGTDLYLKSLEQDSWFFWAASADVWLEERLYDIEPKNKDERPWHRKSGESAAEKAAAISDAIAVLEKIEQKLLSMSCTDLDDKEEPKSQKVVDNAPTEITADYEFAPTFYIGMSFDAADHKAYARLYEAAWHGDTTTIMKLTLVGRTDGNGELQPPLLAAAYYLSRLNRTLGIVPHKYGNQWSPFSLAFLRGHYKAARAILEIVQAQYFEKTEKVRYELMDTGKFDPECDSIDGDDEDMMYRTIIDNDEFTIENIGEVSLQARGTMKPLDILIERCTPLGMHGSEQNRMGLEKPSLIQLAMANNDRQGLRFLLDMAVYFSGQKLGSNDVEAAVQASRLFQDNVETFLHQRLNVQGQMDMLAEVIKLTGVWLPLEKMAKDEGINVKAVPRYYQGLTVYGKKRSDWADAGRTVVHQSTGRETSPLLLAATIGCLEMVEWFLSDAPLRCYLEFTQSKQFRNDKQVRRLSEAPGGSEGAISRWLKKDRDLVLHMAIAGTKNDTVLPLVKCLIKAVPEAVSTRDKEGRTPLCAACRRGLANVARLLIEHGADQNVRQKGTLENLLHQTLSGNPSAKQLKEMLEVFDPEALARMFCERSHHSAPSQGRTPLHNWVVGCLQSERNGRCGLAAAYNNLDGMLAVMRLLLTYSGGRELGQVDGTGNTLLHSLVTRGTDPRIVTALLEADVGQQQALLLHRENAVGLTPPEVCWDWFLSVAVVDSARIRPVPMEFVASWPRTVPRQFVDRARQPLSAKQCAAELLHVVEDMARQHAGKRKLASLHEAEEVTKRLDSELAKKRHPIKLRSAAEA